MTLTTRPLGGGHGGVPDTVRLLYVRACACAHVCVCKILKDKHAKVVIVKQHPNHRLKVASHEKFSFSTLNQ